MQQHVISQLLDHTMTKFEFVRFRDDVCLPQNDDQIRDVLASQAIVRINSYTLGPRGTNIEAACRVWRERMGIGHKHHIIYCDTPETALTQAEAANGEETVGIFWTCAVYHKEHQLFFHNPRAFPFFTQQAMRLDRMQLAVRQGYDLPESIADMRIASHPSPSSLLAHRVNEVIQVASNSLAAKLCSEGLVDACITTEAARSLYQLKAVHYFGSPIMVFFGGIAGRSVDLISRIHAQSEAVQYQIPHCPA